MRRIIALVLTVTAIVVLFTSCKGNGDDTTSALSTSGTSATTESTTTTAPSTTGVTYVLTTNQNKQAPWYTTTRFMPSPDSTTTTQNISGSSVPNMYEDITYPTNNGGAITPSVSAVTSAAKTTEWSTIAQDGSTTKGSSQSSNGTTAAAKAEGAQAVINSTWFDSEGNFCAAIDKEGWGKIKSNSMKIPIYIDGVEAEKPGTLQISSSVDGDGCQYVFVNVAKYDVMEFGGSVSFTIPEGFLKNSSGTRYNYETEVSM